ncbi:MAG: RHS repeat-associated core domain-containing protein [Erysipelotrichaceae bacterium]|nr:RHS repeat-associated core domain-containing protein [Erysipelotrichaceae bacterium]
MKRRDHKKKSKMALETLIFSDSQVKVNGVPASSTTTTISGSDQLTMSFNLDLKPTDVVFEARLLFCKNSATNPGAFEGYLEGETHDRFDSYAGNILYVDLTDSLIAHQGSSSVTALVKTASGESGSLSVYTHLASPTYRPRLEIDVWRNPSDRPFCPISTKSLADGTTVQIGATDGRIRLEKPVFSNVFAYPVSIVYDSLFADTVLRYGLPKGITLSFMDELNVSNKILRRANGSSIAFSPMPGSSSLYFDPRGSGLFLDLSNSNEPRVYDAFTGAYDVFLPGGSLITKVDPAGKTVLSVYWASSLMVATDELGNELRMEGLNLTRGSGISISFTKDSNGIWTGFTYGSGETYTVSADAYGLLSYKTPSLEEALIYRLTATKRPRSLSIGVVQGTSFSMRESDTIDYSPFLTASTDFHGIQTKIAFDSSLETTVLSGDGLMTAFPKPEEAFSSPILDAKGYFKRFSGPLTLNFPISSSNPQILSGSQLVHVHGSANLRAGCTYCAIAEMEFPNWFQLDGTRRGRSVTLAVGINDTSLTSPTITFQGGTKRTTLGYCFFTPHSDCGVIELDIWSSANMRGQGKLLSFSLLLVQEESSFMIADSNGSFGPRLSRNWTRLSRNGSLYLIGVGNRVGGITKKDAVANASLRLRNQYIVFADGLRRAYWGAYAYGTSSHYQQISGSEVAFLTKDERGNEIVHGVSCSMYNLILQKSVMDGTDEVVESKKMDSLLRPYEEENQFGKTNTQYNSNGLPSWVYVLASDGSAGPNIHYSYDSKRRVSSRTDDGPSSDVSWSYSYTGNALHPSTEICSASSEGVILNGYDVKGNPTHYDQDVSSVWQSWSVEQIVRMGGGIGQISFIYGNGCLYTAQTSNFSQLVTTNPAYSSSGDSITTYWGLQSTITAAASLNPFGKPTSLTISNGGSTIPSGTINYGYSITNLCGYGPVLSESQNNGEYSRIYTYDQYGAVSGFSAVYQSSLLGGTVSASYSRDSLGRVSSVSEGRLGTPLSLSFSYVKGTNILSSMVGSIGSGASMATISSSVTFGPFGRPSSTSNSIGLTSVSQNLTYLQRSIGNTPTSLPYISYKSTGCQNGFLLGETMAYDSIGRVSTRSFVGAVSGVDRFFYDANGRIVREDSALYGRTITYEYDSSGNISAIQSCAYTTAANPSVSSEKTFSYDQSWGPSLVSTSDGSISSSSGYPTSIEGQSLSWVCGKLASYGAANMFYDMSGRLCKYSVSGSTTHLIRGADGELIGVKDPVNGDIWFLYGPTGLFGFRHVQNGISEDYAYIFDALGNVAGIVGSSGLKNLYAYDSFGRFKVLKADGDDETSPTAIGNINPIRYKGYFWLDCAGLYLCGSRWYSPNLRRFISPDSPEYLNIKQIGGINPYVYCLNDPVNYSDRYGYSPKWWEWANAIGKIATGIFAVAAGALVIASGVAGVGMLVVAGITVTAGALTTNNGIADTVGLSTGYNYMADGLFQGNKTAYGWYSGITEGVAVAGTIACGGWLRYNAPRISAYHNVGNYQFSNTLSDATHMARPWQNSVLMQQNVIKYGRMAKDGAGWAFTAAGSFNGHGEAWRLIVSVAEETIWHWGFF